jgi:hypothetical protein
LSTKARLLLHGNLDVWNVRAEVNAHRIYSPMVYAFNIPLFLFIVKLKIKLADAGNLYVLDAGLENKKEITRWCV